LNEYESTALEIQSTHMTNSKWNSFKKQPFIDYCRARNGD